MTASSGGFGRHKRKIAPLTFPGENATLAELEEFGLQRAGQLNQHVLGPGDLAHAEWQSLGYEAPDMDIVRAYRLERTREAIKKFDYAGVLVSDPVNVRYTTDSTNMQVWCLHMSTRYAFVPAEGPVVLFDYGNTTRHLHMHNPLIDEIRSSIAFYYMRTGENYDHFAAAWAKEIADLVQQHGGGNKRLAIDHINPEGAHHLEKFGVEIFNGEEVMETARLIKSTEEMKAMRCAIATCEVAMGEMEKALIPGVTENRLWSVLHAENIARGGEWIETRLLASGQRTNPWFQECASQVISDGDIVAFDTDLIGPYGYCADISRTWICGDGQPSDEQREIFQIAKDQIDYNTEIIYPGMSFDEYIEKARQLPEDCMPNRYGSLAHGVGLADEYPALPYLPDWPKKRHSGGFEPGMTICIESYTGRVGGEFGVKLEEQILITETGVEVLSQYPFDERLSA